MESIDKLLDNIGVPGEKEVRQVLQQHPDTTIYVVVGTNEFSRAPYVDNAFLKSEKAKEYRNKTLLAVDNMGKEKYTIIRTTPEELKEGFQYFNDVRMKKYDRAVIYRKLAENILS